MKTFRKIEGIFADLYITQSIKGRHDKSIRQDKIKALLHERPCDEDKKTNYRGKENTHN